MEDKINLNLPTNPALRYILLLGCCLAFGVGISRLIVWVADVPSSPAPRRLLPLIYKEANSYFKGDSIEQFGTMDRYFSTDLQKQFSKVPGLAVYTFGRETRNGKFKELVVTNQTFENDSAYVDARVTYTDGSSKVFRQLFVHEGGQWKIGLMYNKPAPLKRLAR